MIHLNINSIKNNFDELKLLNRGLKSQVIILSETKIDSSYKSDRFRLQGNQINVQDGQKEKRRRTYCITFLQPLLLKLWKHQVNI